MCSVVRMPGLKADWKTLARSDESGSYASGSEGPDWASDVKENGAGALDAVGIDGIDGMGGMGGVGCDWLDWIVGSEFCSCSFQVPARNVGRLC